MGHRHERRKGWGEGFQCEKEWRWATGDEKGRKGRREAGMEMRGKRAEKLKWGVTTKFIHMSKTVRNFLKRKKKNRQVQKASECALIKNEWKTKGTLNLWYSQRQWVPMLSRMMLLQPQFWAPRHSVTYSADDPASAQIWDYSLFTKHVKFFPCIQIWHFTMELKTPFFSYHHSSACKYQINASLDYIMLKHLTFKLLSKLLISFIKTHPRNFGLGLR